MSDIHQIKIIQSGSEVFAFDTLRWPANVFKYPVVYVAQAMNESSPDTNLIGWKWITRDKFEWLVKHYSCIVEYRGPGFLNDRIFYCNNHKCWEIQDQELLDQIESYRLDPDTWEERLI